MFYAWRSIDNNSLTPQCTPSMCVRAIVKWGNQSMRDSIYMAGCGAEALAPHWYMNTLCPREVSFCVKEKERKKPALPITGQSARFGKLQFSTINRTYGHFDARSAPRARKWSVYIGTCVGIAIVSTILKVGWSRVSVGLYEVERNSI